MAESSFKATGELYLSKVTPVIEALFGRFDLSLSPVSNGRVFFHDGEFSPDWNDVRQDLYSKVLIPIMSSPDEQVSEDCLTSVLYVLADQFEQANNDDLMNLIDSVPTDLRENADVTRLYFLATVFDDGHGLRAMHYQSSWASSKPRMGEYGGCSLLESSKFSFSSDCHHDLTWAIEFDKSLLNDDLNLAAQQLASRVGNITAGVIDSEARSCITVSTALQLLARADKDAVAALDTLNALWQQLGQVGINDDGILQDSFLFFPIGTNVHDVWHWFERMNPQFSVAKAMSS